MPKLEKKNVRVNLEYFYSSDIDGSTVTEIIEKFKAYKEKHGPDVLLDFIYTREETTEFAILGKRLETDEELAKRQRFMDAQEERDKTTFNSFKKKYGWE
jgi:hypothetical protein